MATNPFMPNGGVPNAPSRTPAQPDNMFGAPQNGGNPGIAGPTSTAGPSSMAGNPFTTPTASSTYRNPFAANGSDTESGFNTPGSSLINLGQVPGVTAQQYQLPSQVTDWLNGNGGFSPETMAGMNANAKESAANAGQQELAQAKRAEAQSGTSGAGKAAYEGTVARQTGIQQQANLRDVQMQNAQVRLSQQNMAAQLEAQAGQGNMQSANQLALANAQMLYNAMLANQNARLNTQNAVAGLG